MLSPYHDLSVVDDVQGEDEGSDGGVYNVHRPAGEQEGKEAKQDEAEQDAN